MKLVTEDEAANKTRANQKQAGGSTERRGSEDSRRREQRRGMEDQMPTVR